MLRLDVIFNLCTNGTLKNCLKLKPFCFCFCFCFWETLTWFVWLFDGFEVKPLFDY